MICVRRPSLKRIDLLKAVAQYPWKWCYNYNPYNSTSLQISIALKNFCPYVKKKAPMFALLYACMYTCAHNSYMYVYIYRLSGIGLHVNLLRFG